MCTLQKDVVQFHAQQNVCSVLSSLISSIVENVHIGIWSFTFTVEHALPNTLPIFPFYQVFGPLRKASKA
jgi:hypothetical protein